MDLNKCRICTSDKLTQVIDLGEQYITSRFPQYRDYSTPKTGISLCLCGDCGLLQLQQTTVPSELYEYEYGYRSGISQTMRSHLKAYQDEILSKINLSPKDVVVDIGSNDSTFLQFYPVDVRRIGVDPTGKQFESFYKDVELLPTYFTHSNFKDAFGDIKVKIVTSIAMFYDLPNPVQFAKDIYQILDDEGIWTCEQSYLPVMLKTNSLDTICHEHLEYYALRQVSIIAYQAGFKIIDVKFNDSNGGSFRVYMAKINSKHVECTDLIKEISDEEAILKLDNPQTYFQFMQRCRDEINKLTSMVDIINRNNQEVWIYGASTKGNCLLQFANLTESSVKYAVERNLNKVGKMTSTGIPIIGEEEMRKNPPKFLLVLPWHFRKEIVEREKAFLEGGGCIIFPLPHFEIVTSKPKVVITGSQGHIGYYVREQMKDHSILFGFCRDYTDYDSSIMCIPFNINDPIKLEDYLTMIQPDKIVHLSGISSASYSLEHPIDSLETNGMVVAHICDIIHRHGFKTKLFNSSSSEMYKGHGNLVIKDDDTHFKHLHPYSIAKIMGHSMVNFYRDKYGLPFFNGIIFTTESSRKRPEFLLNKIALHAKEWKNNKKSLHLSSLDSSRNIIHASDVASAIDLILDQKHGDDYVICNNSNIKVLDLVVKSYQLWGINLIVDGKNLVDKDTSEIVIEIDGNVREPVTNIQGDNSKLLGLGWSPRYSIDDILDEIYDGKYVS